MHSLRAEICHRAGVNPFQTARAALEGVTLQEQKEGDEPDLLRVCHSVVKEVYALGYRYSSPNNEREDVDDPESKESTAKVSRATFLDWLRCYERHEEGMVSTVDGKGRAMWHEKRWAQKGKTKAGARRPKKGKTISGAQRGGEEQPAKGRKKKKGRAEEEEQEGREEKEEEDGEEDSKAEVGNEEDAQQKKPKGRGKRSAATKVKGARRKRMKTAEQKEEEEDESGGAEVSQAVVSGVESKETPPAAEGDVQEEAEEAVMAKAERPARRGARDVAAEGEAEGGAAASKRGQGRAARAKRSRVVADADDASNPTRRRSARLRG